MERHNDHLLVHALVAQPLGTLNSSESHDERSGAWTQALLLAFLADIPPDLA